MKLSWTEREQGQFIDMFLHLKRTKQYLQKFCSSLGIEREDPKPINHRPRLVIVLLGGWCKHRVPSACDWIIIRVAPVIRGYQSHPSIMRKQLFIIAPLWYVEETYHIVLWSLLSIKSLLNVLYFAILISKEDE